MDVSSNYAPAAQTAVTTFVVGDGASPKDIAALNVAIKHPKVQRRVVLPLLAETVASNASIARRNNALVAIAAMRRHATAATVAAVQRAFVRGTVDRALAAWTLQNVVTAIADDSVQKPSAKEDALRALLLKDNWTIKRWVCWAMGLLSPSYILQVSSASSIKVVTHGEEVFAYSPQLERPSVCAVVRWNDESKAFGIRRGGDDVDVSADWESAAPSIKSYLTESESKVSLASVSIVVDPRAVLQGLQEAIEDGTISFPMSDGSSARIMSEPSATWKAQPEFKVEQVPQLKRRGSTFADDAAAALNSTIATSIAAEERRDEKRSMLPSFDRKNLNALVRILRELLGASRVTSPSERWECSHSAAWINASNSIGNLIEHCFTCRATQIEASLLLSMTKILVSGTHAMDPSMREASINAMGRIAPCWCCASASYEVGIKLFEMEERIIRQCTKNLMDKSWQVRHAATRALQNWGQWVVGSGTAIFEAIHALVNAMLNRHSVNPQAGCRAIAAMGQDGLMTLMAIIKADDSLLPPKVSFHGRKSFCSRVLPDSRLRAGAAKGMAGINPLGYLSVGAKGRIASGGESPVGGQKTLRRAVNVLLECCDDPISIVRAACISTLAKLSRGSSERIVFLRVRCLHPRIYRAMMDPDKIVRLVAAESLAKHGPEGELLLVEAVQRDESALVRAAALHGLMRVGGQSLRSIIGALCDDSKAVRRAARESIESIGPNGLLVSVQRMPRHHIVMTLNAVTNAQQRYGRNDEKDDALPQLLQWLTLQLDRRRRVQQT